MKLPQEFIDRMKILLENEFESFLNTYNQPRHYGFRINTLKISVEEYIELIGKQPERIPWTKDGFYYEQDQSPGKHPYYYAGLYYIQEPSAMAPAEILSVQPGERVLDLCAAPGGKTMQIAASMKGQGVLVANEINASRIKALVKNIELCGVKNAIVTNEAPEKLSGKFESYFDRILVDAPCSGEGMIRKDENARRGWEVYNSAKCSLLQKDILEHADIMLKPGGRLVYSTCTFSLQENEEVIANFIEKHPNYQLINIDKHSGISSGIELEGYENLNLSYCARFWPHKVNGEGHFVAVLEKKYGVESKHSITELKIDEKAYDIVDRFFKRYTNIATPQYLKVYGNNVHAVLPDFPDCSGLNVVRTGWQLGSIQREDFEPYQSLIMGLLAVDIKNTINYDLNSIEVIKYLKGETLFSDDCDGWAAVCIENYPLGWVKAKDGMLKNYYPKGWRKTS